MVWSELSKISSTVACDTGLRADEPEKITSVSESPRRRLAVLSHHPAHRVDDVGLAAAVRADHAGHVGRQVQRGGIDEGFETGELDRGQAHAASGGLGAAPRTERRLLENLDSIPAPSY